MVAFSRTRERKGQRDFKSSSSNRGSRDRMGSSRDSGRDRGSGFTRKASPSMTRVTCSSCGIDCEVPFKPTSKKPVYCSECFSQKEQSDSSTYNSSRSSSRSSSRPFSKSSTVDLIVINDKLNKIMRKLDIR